MKIFNKIETSEKVLAEFGYDTIKRIQYKLFGYTFKTKVESSFEEHEIPNSVIVKVNGEEYKLKIGQKVITRSNEPNEYGIGEIIDFKIVGRYGKPEEALPVVKYNSSEVFMIMGITIPYNDELVKKLDTLKPIEQWNYLCSNVEHAQISEKYGIKYKTFYKSNKKEIN